MATPFVITEATTQNPLIFQKPSSFVSDFDYTLAVYSGCQFACTYCYVPAIQHGLPARRGGWGSYVDLRSQSLELLQQQSGKLAGACIFMSATTDPYQPVEAQQRLTRCVLEELVSLDFAFLLISTRSGLVLRDLDILADARMRQRVEVGISLPSDLPEAHAILEPHTSTFAGRFTVARRLRAAGIAVRIHAAPLARHSPDFARGAADAADWLWIDGAAHGARKTEPGATWLYDFVTAHRIATETQAITGASRVGFGRERFAWRWDQKQQQITAPLGRKGNAHV